MSSWELHTLLRQPFRREITRALRMLCFRERDCTGVVYSAYLEEGERTGNIPWQVGKGERKRGGRQKRLERRERSGRGNKKEKIERKKEKAWGGERRRVQAVVRHRDQARLWLPQGGCLLGLEKRKGPSGTVVYQPRESGPRSQYRGSGLGPAVSARSFLSPLPGDHRVGRDPGGKAPRGARQSRTVWALWARLSSSPGLTCQADYLRRRLIGEAGCNNNRFV